MNKKENSELKVQVHDFWNDKSCGEVYAQGNSELEYYQSQRKARYTLEPYIFDFADFSDGYKKDILEIGVGMGVDHTEWAKSCPKSLAGIDLTPRAVNHSRKNLKVHKLKSNISVADAEKLPFKDKSFDLVYSWGVLHHSPDTPKAINEVYRVLRKGGIARIMIYHKYSVTGYLLWIRYGLFTAKPFRDLDYIYSNYLESPGTKAYSIREANKLFNKFSKINLSTRLSFGELLQGAVGARHKGLLLTILKKIWPRKLIKILFKRHGLLLLIEAKK